MHFLVCGTFWYEYRALRTKNREISHSPWEIHHIADISMFTPTECTKVVLILILYHLGLIYFTKKVGIEILCI